MHGSVKWTLRVQICGELRATHLQTSLASSITDWRRSSHCWHQRALVSTVVSRGRLTYILQCWVCGLWSSKNGDLFVSWLEVAKGVPNQGVDCSVGQFFVFLCVFLFYVYVVFRFLVFLLVGISAVDCLERLVSEMTCCVSSGTLNPTHWLTLPQCRVCR